MTKLCDPMIWPDWPDRVQVIDSKSEEFRNYYPERTCVNKYIGTALLICSECQTLSDTEPQAKYCPNCGARVVSEEEQGHMVADAIRRLEKVVG